MKKKNLRKENKLRKKKIKEDRKKSWEIMFIQKKKQKKKRL